MSSDDEDFVFYGTPIEREEEITTRKKKAVAEASGQLRTAAPPWKQEVTDEEGRRRFHGAFTGGYSAGYYNTVGSKEGWTPQSFTSSRKNRADVKQQNILNFLDDDEKADLEGRTLGTSTQYDTFGFTSVERARKEAQKEQQQRPAAIPGPVPDELIVPTTESIGVKLLKKMGWRQGRSIKDSNKYALYDARREARKAFLALSKNASSKVSATNSDEEDTTRGKDLEIDDDRIFSRSPPAYLLNPKQDLCGLGYDPFKQAPEFREKKRLRISGNQEIEHYKSVSIKGKIGPGFGIGALEELDVEDEDVYASGYDFQDTYVQDIEEPSTENTNILRIMDKKRRDNLPGFKAASIPDQQMARFDPPVIPKDFIPHHKCPPLGNGCNNAETPPPEVPAPEDNNLKVLIEGVATIVARSGKLFEDLSREKNQSNPLFAFLTGGTGSDYYARKLWEQRQKRGDQSRLWEEKGQKSRISEQMTAERRGKILGEKALETSSKDTGYPAAMTGSVNVQFHLSDTFTTTANDQYDPKDRFYDDPAKQKRFEQFLKEKYEGGLRTKDSGGASDMSEAARARERLEFEAAANTMQKENLGKGSMLTNQLLEQLQAPTGLQFTTGVIEKDKAQQEEAVSMFPKREEFQWRPAPILCKRFDLIDPYMGKPPPPPRPRSKIDSLLFMPNTEESTANKQTSSVPQVQDGKQKEVETEVQVENVERPVDLYKAIFSDDSDDEEEATANNRVDDTQKKTEAANIALSRLEAGDFLESLGKELGLEVPHTTPFVVPISEDKAGTRVARHETINMASVDQDSTPVEKERSASQNIRRSDNGETGSKPNILQNTHRVIDDGVSVVEFRTESNAKVPYVVSADRKPKENPSSSSSEDEKSGKRSRSRHHKSRKSSSCDSESDDYRDRHGSSSRRREKGKSREKHSSRRHSKHRKHRNERGEHHKRRKNSS